MMIKLRYITTLLLILCALFSGQTMADTQGHKFFYVQSADSQLRHSADSEELRITAFNAAEDCRENERRCWRRFQHHIMR